MMRCPLCDRRSQPPDWSFAATILVVRCKLVLSLLYATGAAVIDETALDVPPLEVPTLYWVAFCAGTVLMLVLDMFVFHRHSHEPSLRESTLWTLFWCGLAIAFNAWIWYWAGPTHAIHFFTG